MKLSGIIFVLTNETIDIKVYGNTMLHDENESD